MEYLRLLWPETGQHAVVASRNIVPMLRRLYFIFLIKKSWFIFWRCKRILFVEILPMKELSVLMVCKHAHEIYNVDATSGIALAR